MTQLQMFGGDWTEEKLLRIKKYLSAYTTILSKRRALKTAYIDAFAGTGYRQLKFQLNPNEPLFPDLLEEDIEKFLQGSAQIALQTEPRFDKYIFIENDKERFNELSKLRTDFPKLANDIKLEMADSNIYLQNLCTNRNWDKYRAVLFLDPFGMQVEWKTIVAIANTEAIDMWLLFPLGVAVNRLLRNDGQIDDNFKNKLDIMFGTSNWFSAFYKVKVEQTLFGEKESLQKVITLEGIGKYYLDRLKSVFAGVAEEPLILRNSKNNPIYLLYFAAGNPRAVDTAVKIAQDVLRK